MRVSFVTIEFLNIEVRFLLDHLLTSNDVNALFGNFYATTAEVVDGVVVGG